MTVAELSTILEVSEVTIRKDLDVLESQGLILRVHGKAVVSGLGHAERRFAARQNQHSDQKQRIAEAAAALIRNDQTIFLDASTTTFQITPLIADRQNVLVVTSGLYTALALAFCPGIRVCIAGDTLRSQSYSLSGEIAENVRRLWLDLGFFGASGLTSEDGLLEADLLEAKLKRQMVTAVRTVVGLVDSSKFGGGGASAYALPSEIDSIITDTHAPSTIVDALSAQGIQINRV
jgi:DeoR family transcriptional regulator of aga operon